MGRLAGKVAFITGAARGQGRSHAVRMAQEGADIIAIDLCGQVRTVPYPLATPDDLAETVRLVEGLDRQIFVAEADVRERSSLAAAFDAGFDQLGRIDIVVANAGIMPTIGELADTDEAWQDAIDVMLTGAFNTIRVAVPSMIEQGSGGAIVLTSSTAGLSGLTTGTAGSHGYSAAKHGVVGLMRGYATSLAEHSIRVNTVHPTAVETPMIVNDAFTRYAEENQETVAKWQNLLPVPSIEPIDVSNAIVWLCSEEARYITGVTLPVDAGFLTR